MLRLKVKEVAREKNFSMGRLSRLANVDRSTLKLIYDRADYNPTIGTLWRIAKILKVKVDDLVEEIPDPDEGED
jgi:DNA-binding Xre family transcriptional regulator